LKNTKYISANKRTAQTDQTKIVTTDNNITVKGTYLFTDGFV